MNKFVTIEAPLTGVGSAEWWMKNIERDKGIRKKLTPTWKKNLRRYKGEKPNLYGVTSQETVSVNKDFANTESKKSQLFFQSPELELTAKRNADQQAQPLAQAVINQFLTHEVPMLSTIDEILMDVICPAGIGFIEVGYQAYEGEPITEPVMEPEGGFMAQLMSVVGQQPKMVPKIGTDGQPVVNYLPNILREKWYADRVSPAAAIVPSNFTGSDYDQAPYLGKDFLLTAEEIHSAFGISPDELPTTDIDENRLSEDPELGIADQKIAGVLIWYRSSYARQDVTDPERFSQLVIVNGRGGNRRNAQILIHRDSPYQRLDQRGAYERGMRGNPINVFTLRYTSDSAYPSSDCTMSRPAVEELCMSRSQMQQQRRRNLPLRWVDKTRDGAKDLVERMEKAVTGGVVLTTGPGGELMGVVTPANMPMENFRFNDEFAKDSAEIWALGANQNGTPVDASTATEAQIMQRNTDTRLAKERGRVLTTYVKMAEKLFSLIQLFADETQFVEMVGEDGAKVLTEWNKTSVSGMFRFSAKPDSSIRIDAAQDRERWLRVYNLFANDPNVNRIELDRLILSKLGADWSRILNSEPPKPPEPEKPKVSLSITMADLAAGSPTAPIGYAILKDAGIDIDDMAKSVSGILGVMNDRAQQQAAFVKHPGAAKEIETIDQHAADRTGDRSGPKVGQLSEPQVIQ